MIEIGGYLGLEQFENNEYYRNLIPLNYGRNALLYLVMARKIKKIYIPYYLCNSISDALIKNGCEFEFYNVAADFSPVFNKELAEGSFLYVVNYYGQLTNAKICSLQAKQVIIDNTQAFFQEPVAGVDTIYGCRKFFGVPDGAYLSTNCNFEGVFEQDISMNRLEHLVGRYEENASKYYDAFRKNDEEIAAEPIKYMSKLTHNILGAIDYERVRQFRNENYEYLEKALGKRNKLKLIKPEGPFAYPYYAENGMIIKEKLALKKIYVPTLWQNVLLDEKSENVERDYAANIIPLPCDQRYNEENMRYIVENLAQFI